MSNFRKFIARKIAYPLQDYYNKTSIISTRDFLLESQLWSESKILEFQFDKLKRLIEHSYQNVPFYKDLFNSIHLKPSDIKGFEDIPKIPVLTKEIARKENNKLISVHHSNTKVLKGFTGGTTGPPLKLLRDSSDLTYTWAAFFRWYKWMGLEIGDPVSKIWGTPTVLSQPFKRKITDSVKNWYYNRKLVNSFNLNDNTIINVIKQFNYFEPYLIRGYLSAFIQIAEYMKQNNIKLNFTPKAVSPTTETLFDPFRKLIQEQFGAPVYDQYGCGECNSIAFEAGDGLGMYVASEHVYLEIVDSDNNPKKEGRVIFTNLDNFAMPFIRYENGDSGEFSSISTGKKFNLPILKRISGRTADTITLVNGSKVHGVFFTDILRELFSENSDYVRRFQAYQETPGNLEFRIETGKGTDKEFISKLEHVLNRYFNNVKIVVMESLPLDSSGKFRYVVSKTGNK